MSNRIDEDGECWEAWKNGIKKEERKRQIMKAIKKET